MNNNTLLEGYPKELDIVLLQIGQKRQLIMLDEMFADFYIFLNEVKDFNQFSKEGNNLVSEVEKAELGKLLPKMLETINSQTSINVKEKGLKDKKPYLETGKSIPLVKHFFEDSELTLIVTLLKRIYDELNVSFKVFVSFVARELII